MVGKFRTSTFRDRFLLQHALKFYIPLRRFVTVFLNKDEVIRFAGFAGFQVKAIEGHLDSSTERRLNKPSVASVIWITNATTGAGKVPFFFMKYRLLFAGTTCRTYR